MCNLHMLSMILLRWIRKSAIINPFNPDMYFFAIYVSILCETTCTPCAPNSVLHIDLYVLVDLYMIAFCSIIYYFFLSFMFSRKSLTLLCHLRYQMESAENQGVLSLSELIMRCYMCIKHQRLLVIWSTHYSDVIMGAMASQITSLTSVYSTVNSGADQRKHQNSASLAFVRGIHRWPANSPHKWPVTRKKIPFDDVIMYSANYYSWQNW